MPIDTTKPNFLHQSNCNKKKKAKFFFWKNRKKIKNSEIALLEQCGKQHKWINKKEPMRNQIQKSNVERLLKRRRRNTGRATKHANVREEATSEQNEQREVQPEEERKELKVKRRRKEGTPWERKLKGESMASARWRSGGIDRGVERWGEDDDFGGGWVQFAAKTCSLDSDPKRVCLFWILSTTCSLDSNKFHRELNSYLLMLFFCIINTKI